VHSQARHPFRLLVMCCYFVWVVACATGCFVIIDAGCTGPGMIAVINLRNTASSRELRS
jgi:hypothetical protein